MKKPSDQQVRAAAGPSGCPDEKLTKRYPTVVEHLSTDRWDDGTVREPSSVAVSLRDGMIQVALNDKDGKRSMYTTAGSLEEALGLLERALVSGAGEWRPWKSGKKR